MSERQQDAVSSSDSWSVQPSAAETAGVQRYRITTEGQAISLREVLSLWRESAGFRTFFSAILADTPYLAYRWETPPATAATLGRPFEFVVLDSPSLERPASSSAFRNQFRGAGAGEVIAFPNLGGDGIMVAPVPRDARSSYCHLATFLRNAPDRQKHLLWQRVGEVFEREIGSKPLWLSTAGGGVPWLHVRVDERPKYYGYAPFRDPAYGVSQ